MNYNPSIRSPKEEYERFTESVRDSKKRNRAILQMYIEEELQTQRADMEQPFYAERTKVRQLLTDCCFFTDTPLITRVQDMYRINALLEYLIANPAFLSHFAEFRSILLQKLQEVSYPKDEVLFVRFIRMLCDLQDRGDYVVASRSETSIAKTWLQYEFR